MYLSIGADEAVWPDDRGAIVERVARSPADAVNDRGAGPAGLFQPSLRRRPIRHRLGQRESLLPRCKDIAGIAQLGEHDQPCALACGLGDLVQRVRHIGFLLADLRLHLDTGDRDRAFSLHCTTPLRSQSLGCMSFQPCPRSYASAARIRVISSKGGLASCRPMVSPVLSSPQGSDIAGTPAKFQG